MFQIFMASENAPSSQAEGKACQFEDQSSSMSHKFPQVPTTGRNQQRLEPPQSVMAREIARGLETWLADCGGGSSLLPPAEHQY